MNTMKDKKQSKAGNQKEKSKANIFSLSRQYILSHNYPTVSLSHKQPH